ncbi:hypothetical protein ACW9KT_15460 [Hymenobacter sp. HD11105]
MHVTFLPDGTVALKLSDPQEAKVIAAAAAQRAKEDAEQAALSQVYTLEELEGRMKMGRTSLLKYLNLAECNGGIRHRKAGSKYLVTEQAIRDWFGDKSNAA